MDNFKNENNITSIIGRDVSVGGNLSYNNKNENDNYNVVPDVYQYVNEFKNPRDVDMNEMDDVVGMYHGENLVAGRPRPHDPNSIVQIPDLINYQKPPDNLNLPKYDYSQKVFEYKPIIFDKPKKKYRFMVNSKRFMDPSKFYLVIDVINTNLNNFLQLDGSYHSLIKSISFIHNGVVLEKIGNYNIVVNFINDMIYKMNKFHNNHERVKYDLCESTKEDVIQPSEYGTNLIYNPPQFSFDYIQCKNIVDGKLNFEPNNKQRYVIPIFSYLFGNGTQSDFKLVPLGLFNRGLEIEIEFNENAFFVPVFSAKLSDIVNASINNDDYLIYRMCAQELSELKRISDQIISRPLNFARSDNRMAKQKSTVSLDTHEVVKMAGLGNCLFDSMAYSIYDDITRGGELRAKVVEYVKNQGAAMIFEIKPYLERILEGIRNAGGGPVNQYNNYLTYEYWKYESVGGRAHYLLSDSSVYTNDRNEQLTNIRSEINKYLNLVSLNGIQAGALEIYVMSKMFERPIEVWYNTSPDPNVVTQISFSSIFSPSIEKEPIVLLYSASNPLPNLAGVDNDLYTVSYVWGHYDVLKPKEKNWGFKGLYFEPRDFFNLTQITGDMNKLFEMKFLKDHILNNINLDVLSELLKSIGKDKFFQYLEMNVGRMFKYDSSTLIQFFGAGRINPNVEDKTAPIVNSDINIIFESIRDKDMDKLKPYINDEFLLNLVSKIKVGNQSKVAMFKEMVLLSIGLQKFVLIDFNEKILQLDEKIVDFYLASLQNSYGQQDRYFNRINVIGGGPLRFRTDRLVTHNTGYASHKNRNVDLGPITQVNVILGIGDGPLHLLPLFELQQTFDVIKGNFTDDVAMNMISTYVRATDVQFIVDRTVVVRPFNAVVRGIENVIDLSIGYNWRKYDSVVKVMGIPKVKKGDNGLVDLNSLEYSGFSQNIVGFEMIAGSVLYTMKNYIDIQTFKDSLKSGYNDFVLFNYCFYRNSNHIITSIVFNDLAAIENLNLGINITTDFGTILRTRLKDIIYSRLIDNPMNFADVVRMVEMCAPFRYEDVNQNDYNFGGVLSSGSNPKDVYAATYNDITEKYLHWLSFWMYYVFEFLVNVFGFDSKSNLAYLSRGFVFNNVQYASTSVLDIFQLFAPRINDVVNIQADIVNNGVTIVPAGPYVLLQRGLVDALFFRYKCKDVLNILIENKLFILHGNFYYRSVSMFRDLITSEYFLKNVKIIDHTMYGLYYNFSIGLLKFGTIIEQLFKTISFFTDRYEFLDVYYRLYSFIKFGDESKQLVDHCVDLKQMHYFSNLFDVMEAIKTQINGGGSFVAAVGRIGNIANLSSHLNDVTIELNTRNQFQVTELYGNLFNSGIYQKLSLLESQFNEEFYTEFLEFLKKPNVLSTRFIEKVYNIYGPDMTYTIVEHYMPEFFDIKRKDSVMMMLYQRNFKELLSYINPLFYTKFHTIENITNYNPFSIVKKIESLLPSDLRERFNKMVKTGKLLENAYNYTTSDNVITNITAVLSKVMYLIESNKDDFVVPSVLYGSDLNVKIIDRLRYLSLNSKVIYEPLIGGGLGDFFTKVKDVVSYGPKFLINMSVSGLKKVAEKTRDAIKWVFSGLSSKAVENYRLYGKYDSAVDRAYEINPTLYYTVKSFAANLDLNNVDLNHYITSTFEVNPTNVYNVIDYIICEKMRIYLHDSFYSVKGTIPSEYSEIYLRAVTRGYLNEIEIYGRDLRVILTKHNIGADFDDATVSKNVTNESMVLLNFGLLNSLFKELNYNPVTVVNIFRTQLTRKLRILNGIDNDANMNANAKVTAIREAIQLFAIPNCPINLIMFSILWTKKKTQVVESFINSLNINLLESMNNAELRRNDPALATIRDFYDNQIYYNRISLDIAANTENINRLNVSIVNLTAEYDQMIIAKQELLTKISENDSSNQFLLQKTANNFTLTDSEEEFRRRYDTFRRELTNQLNILENRLQNNIDERAANLRDIELSRTEKQRLGVENQVVTAEMQRLLNLVRTNPKMNQMYGVNATTSVPQINELIAGILKTFFRINQDKTLTALPNVNNISYPILDTLLGAFARCQARLEEFRRVLVVDAEPAMDSNAIVAVLRTFNRISSRLRTDIKPVSANYMNLNTETTKYVDVAILNLDLKEKVDLMFSFGGTVFRYNYFNKVMVIGYSDSLKNKEHYVHDRSYPSNTRNYDFYTFKELKYVQNSFNEVYDSETKTVEDMYKYYMMENSKVSSYLLDIPYKITGIHGTVFLALYQIMQILSFKSSENLYRGLMFLVLDVLKVCYTSLKANSSLTTVEIGRVMNLQKELNDYITLYNKLHNTSYETIDNVLLDLEDPKTYVSIMKRMQADYSLFYEKKLTRQFDYESINEHQSNYGSLDISRNYELENVSLHTTEFEFRDYKPSELTVNGYGRQYRRFMIIHKEEFNVIPPSRIDLTMQRNMINNFYQIFHSSAYKDKPNARQLCRYSRCVKKYGLQIGSEVYPNNYITGDNSHYSKCNQFLDNLNKCFDLSVSCLNRYNTCLNESTNLYIAKKTFGIPNTSLFKFSPKTNLFFSYTFGHGNEVLGKNIIGVSFDYLAKRIGQSINLLEQKVVIECESSLKNEDNDSDLYETYIIIEYEDYANVNSEGMIEQKVFADIQI